MFSLATISMPFTSSPYREMFHLAESFNGDLSKWSTSNVKNMARTFSGAKSFNSDISNWDVSTVMIYWWVYQIDLPQIGERTPSSWIVLYDRGCEVRLYTLGPAHVRCLLTSIPWCTKLTPGISRIKTGHIFGDDNPRQHPAGRRLIYRQVSIWRGKMRTTKVFSLELPVVTLFFRGFSIFATFFLFQRWCDKRMGPLSIWFWWRRDLAWISANGQYTLFAGGWGMLWM